MIRDRRKHKRIVPQQFAFFQIHGDDGGKVLNVSESGLSFETFSPLEQQGEILCWFSLDLQERIDALAEVAWVDALGTTGGLRFVELADEARKRIRDFVRQNSAAKRGVPAHERARAPILSVQRQAEAASHFGGTDAEHPGAEVPSDFATFHSAHLIPEEHYQSALRRQLIRGVLIGTFLSSLVAAAVLKFADGRKQQGVALRAEQAAEANRDTPARTPSSTDLNRSGGSSATGLSGMTSATPSNSALDEPSSPRAGRRFSPIRQEVLVPINPRTEPTSSARKIAATPEQLWSSMEAGNDKAAVALADMYLRGEGVPVNCDQARVLLLVASKKRNAQAIKKLQQLSQTGCPAP